MDSKNKLIKVLGSFTTAQAAESVFAKAEYYPDKIVVYLPNTPYTKVDDILERRMRNASFGEEDQFIKETNLERSIRKTKKSIRDYVLCNHFDMFATFTFAEDRQNVDRCKQKITDWIKNQKKRKGKFSFLIVPELHKDGESLHFHGLLKGYKGQIEPAYHPRTGKPLIKNGRQAYIIPNYTLGFTDLKLIDTDIKSREKIGHYIAKYITKDMPVFSGKNRYRASHDLKKPFVSENISDWHTKLAPKKSYENDFGRFLEFSYPDKEHELYQEIMSEYLVNKVFFEDD